MVVFAGILLASFLVKTGQDGQRVDYFRADSAWAAHQPATTAIRADKPGK